MKKVDYYIVVIRCLFKNYNRCLTLLRNKLISKHNMVAYEIYNWNITYIILKYIGQQSGKAWLTSLFNQYEVKHVCYIFNYWYYIENITL